MIGCREGFWKPAAALRVTRHRVRPAHFVKEATTPPQRAARPARCRSEKPRRVSCRCFPVCPPPPPSPPRSPLPARPSPKSAARAAGLRSVRLRQLHLRAGQSVGVRLTNTAARGTAIVTVRYVDAGGPGRAHQHGEHRPRRPFRRCHLRDGCHRPANRSVSGQHGRRRRQREPLRRRWPRAVDHAGADAADLNGTSRPASPLQARRLAADLGIVVAVVDSVACRVSRDSRARRAIHRAHPVDRLPDLERACQGQSAERPSGVHHGQHRARRTVPEGPEAVLRRGDWPFQAGMPRAGMAS